MAVWLALSVTVMLKFWVPAESGVPEMPPVLVDKANPAGREPPVTA